jgi:hypothetical protein
MKRILLASIASIAAFAIAPAASATVYMVNATPFFTATPGPDGTFAGAFKITGIAAGAFSDSFTFTLPANGLGSGTVTTSASVVGSPNDLDFTSVFVNGIAAPITLLDPAGLGEVAFKNQVPIVAGMLNTITVSGFSRGGGAYGGQLSFIPTAMVPEPATWAMMLVGFGLMSVAMRYRRRSTTVVYA